MSQAKKDQNAVSTLIGVSSVDNVTPTLIAVDPVTGRMLVDIAGGGTGTVTSVSVVTANGVSGTVATATTTPAITLTLGAITPTSTNGVSAATMAFMDATSSVQTQLNSKGTGNGTVTAVSVASTNGFSGSSSGGATPALTIATSITGILQGNGTAISAASTIGTGSVVLATSATLVTPSIGAATASSLSAATSNSINFASGTYNTIRTYAPSAAGTATLDLSTGNVHHITMPAGNITIAISNGNAGQCYIVRILQDATGSRTVTWFTTIKWAGGSPPTLTTTASKADTMGFEVTGTNTYDGFVVGQNI